MKIWIDYLDIDLPYRYLAIKIEYSVDTSLKVVRNRFTGNNGVESGNYSQGLPAQSGHNNYTLGLM